MYHSQTGNTKKVAEAIAEAVGVKAEEISVTNLTETIDLLFIGDGNYGQKIDQKTVNFIKKMTAHQVRNAAIFGTYGGQTGALSQMQELITQQGIQVADRTFGCKGKFWLIFNRNHPDDKDLNAAREFARQMVVKMAQPK